VLERADACSGEPLSMALLDLDDFKAFKTPTATRQAVDC
jgi:hypothetical protein